ncbi:MAG TPA: hypothetical protein VJQ56_07875, partial [Blastocatellia bacterium]|nr:hypothetical protein [Blastocatellia bacterium]
GRARDTLLIACLDNSGVSLARGGGPAASSAARSLLRSRILFGGCLFFRLRGLGLFLAAPEVLPVSNGILASITKVPTRQAAARVNIIRPTA